MFKIAVSSGNGPLVIAMLNKACEGCKEREEEQPWKPELFKVGKLKLNEQIS